MKFCFLGAYDPCYQRNVVIKKGLAVLGDEVAEYRIDPGSRVWLRYPRLLALVAGVRPHSGPRLSLSRFDALVVPEFCQKDVPLARFLATLFAKPLIFDPLASRYETKILDWRRRPPSSLYAWWNFMIDDWSFRLSDCILADTGAHKDYYCREYGVPANKIGVVPVGYDDTVFDPDRFPDLRKDGQFIVLFFGSFLPLHGVEFIIEAARLVRGRDPSVLFRFVGSGQTRKRAEALAVEKSPSNCVFESWVSHYQLPSIIASSDICLGIFGRTEKARRVVPHKLYQSMGMGKAVITARTPAVEEFFSHDENIILCGEPYAETLAAAVLDLKKDRERGDTIARNGRRLAKTRFAPAAIALQFQEFVKKRLAEKRT